MLRLDIKMFSSLAFVESYSVVVYFNDLKQYLIEKYIKIYEEDTLLSVGLMDLINYF
jgi:hypothetical protein